MDKSLQGVLVIVSTVFVLYTAMIDPVAAITVAGVAVICYFGYTKIFEKKSTTKKVAKKNKRK